MQITLVPSRSWINRPGQYRPETDARDQFEMHIYQSAIYQGILHSLRQFEATAELPLSSLIVWKRYPVFYTKMIVWIKNRNCLSVWAVTFHNNVVNKNFIISIHIHIHVRCTGNLPGGAASPTSLTSQGSVRLGWAKAAKTMITCFSIL